MKNLKQSLGDIILCLGEIVVGILLLIDPVGFTSGIIIALGWLLLIAGIWSIIQYFRAPAAEAAKGQGLVKGLCAGMVGLFCALRSGWFIATFPLLTLLYGVAILLIGLVRVQRAVDRLRMKRADWKWAALAAVLALVFAGIILCNPFGSVVLMWIFVAISLIVEAVVDLTALIFANIRK